MSDEPNSKQSEKSLQGATASLDSPQALRQAVEQAFDYRGDVTIETTDGRTMQGYVFDRCHEPPDPTLRIMLTDGSRLTIPYAQVAQLAFSGRDPAAGKSWETWVRKYAQKKMRGEAASIEAEPLE